MTKENRSDGGTHEWKIKLAGSFLTAREVNKAFNMGLQSAVFVLEKAESLSPEGRKYLIDELKKNISKGDGGYTPRLAEYISGNNASPNHQMDKE